MLIVQLHQFSTAVSEYLAGIEMTERDACIRPNRRKKSGSLARPQASNSKVGKVLEGTGAFWYRQRQHHGDHL